MVLVIASTVFFLPFFLFLLLSLFTLIIIGYHEYQLQKQDPSGRNIWGALALTGLLLTLSLLLTKNERLQWFFGELSLFWFIKACTSVYFKFQDNNDAAEVDSVSATVPATADNYDVINKKIDALGAMLVHIFNQQTASVQHYNAQNNNIMKFLTQLADTVTDIKNTQDEMGTREEPISVELKTVLENFKSKFENDINNSLNTKRFTGDSELKEIMDLLNHVTKTLQSIDSTHAFQLQAIQATFQMHEEAIREKKVRGDEAVEIISDNSVIKKSILDGIETAKKTIDICVFNLTDPEVLEELLKKEIPIRIIIDGPSLNSKINNSSAGSLNPTTVELLHKLNKRENVIIKSFAGNNGRGHMHRKEMIIDSHLTLTGSANYSKNAFGPSIERLYIFKGSEYSKIHELNFDELWNGLPVNTIL